MDRLRNYDIEFSGLKNGRHEFRFEAGKAFFQMFDTEQEFTEPHIIADIILEKHTTFLELELDMRGTVQLVCDITTNSFRQPIENGLKVLIKFGEEYDDSDEEVITIPQQSHAFNVAQLIYENVMLAVPMKKISPEVTDEDLAVLEQFSPKDTAESDAKEEQQTDPRWNALKKLKDKN